MSNSEADENWLSNFSVDRKRPVSDQIYEVLKSAIISNRLLPGTPISENRICSLIDVSRTPVRAAMGKLSEEGLVDVFPQLGSFVSKISIKGVANDHFVRRALEIAVLHEARKSWSPAATALAREAIKNQIGALIAKDKADFFDHDLAFHKVFAIVAKLEGVWPAILNVRTKLSRFHNLMGKEDRLPEVINEHTAIVDAMAIGDFAAAEQLLINHLDKGLDTIFALPEVFGAYLCDVPDPESMYFAQRGLSQPANPMPGAADDENAIRR